jgi:predicted transcriptional regulator
MALKAGRSARTLRVGIADLSTQRRAPWQSRAARSRRAPDEPKVWFPSTESFGKVLSTGNRALLARIQRDRPDSLQALSELTGRAVSNLSRTLRTMERYGLVALTRGPRGTLRPEVPYDRIDLQVPLRAEAAE